MRQQAELQNASGKLMLVFKYLGADFAEGKVTGFMTVNQAREYYRNHVNDKDFLEFARVEDVDGHFVQPIV